MRRISFDERPSCGPSCRRESRIIHPVNDIGWDDGKRTVALSGRLFADRLRIGAADRNQQYQAGDDEPHRPTMSARVPGDRSAPPTLKPVSLSPWASMRSDLRAFEGSRTCAVRRKWTNCSRSARER